MGKNQDPGSGINIPHPQHCFQLFNSKRCFQDWRHPLTGAPLREKDIIFIQRGSTGFSAANPELMAERDRPTLAIS
jgi:hypothetical protein